MTDEEVKFVVSKHYPRFNSQENIVFLTDYKYWAKHENELQAWCDTYECRLSGSIVIIPDDKMLNLFVLKWA